MKKIAILTLAITLVLALFACDFPTEAQLGTSEFSLILPAGYATAEDDFDEDQVAYFYKDDESVDFDVYQWEKGDEYTLESEANYFAAQYGTVAESININGFDAMKYVSTEEYDGGLVFNGYRVSVWDNGKLGNG